MEEYKDKQNDDPEALILYLAYFYTLEESVWTSHWCKHA